MYFLCAGVISFKHFPLAHAFAKKSKPKKKKKQQKKKQKKKREAVVYTRAHKGLGPGNLKMKVRNFFRALCGMIRASASTHAIPVPGQLQYPGTPLT